MLSLPLSYTSCICNRNIPVVKNTEMKMISKGRKHFIREVWKFASL